MTGPSAWGGNTEAQKEIESLPVWITSPAEVDLLTGDCKAMWQALSAEIGYICSEWATMENRMEILFACVLRTEVASAKVIFSTLTSNRLNRDCILNTSRLMIHSETHLHSIERILARIRKAAAKRNFLVHGTAGMNTKYPGRMTIYGTSADLEPALAHYESWSISDLQDFRRHLGTITSDLDKLFRVIDRAKRRPLHETRGKEPDAPWVMANSPRRVRPSKQPTQPKSSQRSQRKPTKLSSAQKRALREKDGAP
jgi:hypothetical protein